MNRIEKIFQNTKGALIVCDCCGAPTMSESAERLDIILKNGADIVELYLPFSDPMADGAVLQAASQQALANGYVAITPTRIDLTDYDLLREMKSWDL